MGPKRPFGSILGLQNKAKRKRQLISVPIVVEKGCYHLPCHASSIRSVKLEIVAFSDGVTLICPMNSLFFSRVTDPENVSHKFPVVAKQDGRIIYRDNKTIHCDAELQNRFRSFELLLVIIGMYEAKQVGRIRELGSVCTRATASIEGQI